MRLAARLGAVLLCGVVAAGCAHYKVNDPLTRYTPDSGHRFPAVSGDRPDPADDLFVCLSFSGGGTRAAAFAYGALLKLKSVEIPRAGSGKSLLDEVDCIAGISGGAFTASYYGLFGAKDLERFYRDFLIRDIEKELAIGVANPVNLWRLASPYFSRIDFAAELYDETVFQRKTFSALAERRRPFVILHASSMANGAPFEFTQAEFDFLGSDLGSFPVARAVAASSAFPFLLSPVSLRSYPPPADFKIPDDVKMAVDGDRVSRELNPMRFYWGRQHLDLMSKKNDKGEWEPKWVHLLDGGLTDNIGLRSILRAYDRGFIRQRINLGHIKRLVVIAVNARTDPPEELSRSEKSPSLLDVFLKTATVSMENLSVDTLDYGLSRQREREQDQTNVRKCNESLAACRAPLLPTFAQEIRTCFVEISFEGLQSPEREKFLSLPTTFALGKDQVDSLIGVAGKLLDESPGFQKLLKALGGESTLGAGVAGLSGNCS